MTEVTTEQTSQSSLISFQNGPPSTWEENSFRRRSLETLGQYLPEKKPEPVALEIVPHPNAPLFSLPDWREILQNALAETQSTTTISNEMREVIRQAGLVSLWFYGRCICAQDGPYTLLTDHIHVDMCNFRQRLLYPAARGAMAIFRGGFKTTIGTELATAWELHRDPDLTVKFTGASEDRAFSYFESVKKIFESESNGFYYPDSYVPTSGKRDRSWNNDRLIVPNQAHRSRDPSLQYGGVGGKSAGIHVKLHVIDDPVEFNDLNSGRLSSTDMYRITNWIWANETSLLFDMHTSRIMFNGTRYATDDVLSTIIPRVRAFYGYPMDNTDPNPDGSWVFYYRKALEDGMLVFPEMLDYGKLMEMAENDWWTFATQYLNDPQNTGIAEFAEYDIKEAIIEHDEKADEWYVQLPYYDERDKRRYAFSECDILQSSDPAGTERYVSSKTSRSANGILITTPKCEYIFYNVRAGYVSILDLFDMMFENMKTYGSWIRQSVLEEQGPFKTLHPILEREENMRKLWLNLTPVTATGDKDASIRSVLQPELAKGKAHTDEHSRDIIMEEVRSFPASRKKDILDMMKIAIKASMRPLSQEDIREEEEFNERWNNRRRGAAGY